MDCSGWFKFKVDLPASLNGDSLPAIDSIETHSFLISELGVSKYFLAD